MSKANFLTRIIRFDLYNSNKIYIHGIVCDGSVKCENVVVNIDADRVDCLFKTNCGNEIKESYRPEISNTVISVDSVKQEEKNKKEEGIYLDRDIV